MPERVTSESVEGFRLSPQQRSLWEWGMVGRPFRSQAVLSLRGDLDHRHLRRALHRLVVRHQALRTSFRQLPWMKLPVQAPNEVDEVPVSASDLTALPGGGVATAVDEALDEEWSRELPLDADLPVRFRVLRLAPDHHALVVTLPALCADPRSLAALISELSECLDPDAASGSPEPIQYVQFAEWRNGLLEEAEEDEGARFWRDQGPSQPVPALPFESPGGGLVGDDGALLGTVRQRLERETRARAEGLAERLRCDLEAVLQAAWHLLLARITLAAEVRVWCLTDGRKFEELDRTLGLLAAHLPLRTVVDGASTFEELVLQVAELRRQASLHQELFAAEERSEEEPPDAQVGFEVHPEPPRMRKDGLEISLDRSRWHLRRFRLVLAVTPEPPEADFELRYDRRQLTASAARWMAVRYASLLGDAVARPGEPSQALGLVHRAERHLLVREWNDTAAPIDGTPVPALIDRRAQEHPDALAVVAGSRALTYGELDRRSGRLARRLRALGVGPESRVALFLDRCPDLVVAALAVWRAGAGFVPLDPSQPPARRSRMIADAGVRVLLTSGRPPHGSSIADGSNPQSVPVDVPAGDADPPLPPEPPSAGQLAYALYTSGSTGRPKAVAVPHGALANLLAALRLTAYAGVPAGARVTMNAPLAFDSSLKQLVQLADGRTVELVPEDVRPDGERMLAFLETRRPDVLDCTPSQASLLLECGFGKPGRTLPVRRILLGGEAVEEGLWSRLAAVEGLVAVNLYGPTECTVDASLAAIEAARRGGGPTVGRPLANLRVHLLQPHLALAPTGVVGELCIAGRGVARGYLRRPGRTAECFVPDPFSSRPGGRLYRSGDLGRRAADGRIRFVGRRDHQVKLRGFRIELGEIEAVLQSLPAVRQAAVDVRGAGAGDRLVAYWAGPRSAEVDTEEIRRQLREALPEYMVPLRFVRLDSLPLTLNGKIAREALPEPDDVDPEAGADPVPLRTGTEEILGGVWREVLGVDGIGGRSDFFRLGGHSLLATRLMSRVRSRFSVELPLRTLFEAPTIEGLAARIEGEIRGGSSAVTPPIEPIPRHRDLPLSFAQQRLWFLDQLDPGNSAYNVPACVRLEGSLHPALLAQAISALMDRHEVLRARFLERGGEPVQRIEPPGPVRLPLIDLQSLPHAAKDREVTRLADAEVRRPFDLRWSPLLRVSLARVREDDHVVLATLHHIVSDAWSRGILRRELVTFYEALATGSRPDLPALEVQYADYAHWQRSWLQGRVLEEQLGYWRRQLAGAPELLDLPTDFQRPERQSYRGAIERTSFTPELAEALDEVAGRYQVTLYMVLLASLAVLLHGLTGRSDLPIGSSIANRNRREVEGLIGFFVNVLVMRLDLSGDPGFDELLARVREVSLGAYAHQDLPFEKLVEELRRGGRERDRNPLFQVAFTFENVPRAERELPGLRARDVEMEIDTAIFDLALVMQRSSEGLHAWIRYRTELFHAETIRWILEQLGLVLESVAARADARIGELAGQLSRAERERRARQEEELSKASTSKLRVARRRAVGGS